MAQSQYDASREDAAASEVFSLAWSKSMRSIGNGQCVEAAGLGGGRLAVRDSVDKTGPIVIFGREAWRDFLKRVKRGESDIV